MKQIKAIQTRYKGHHFRSRLEARWAVFLDHLGVPWEYEVEGYELPNGVKYLPDFWLPDNGVFLEIKRGNLSFEEAEAAEHKAESLAVYNGTPVLLATGNPGNALVSVFAPDLNALPFPKGETFVAFDFDEKTQLLALWSAEHEPHFLEAEIDPWGREHYFMAYSAGFFASTYLVCHADHPALEERRRKELIGVTGPDGIPLSAKAKNAVAAARSARFEFGESGAT